MKRIKILAGILFLSLSAFSQTLFSYGNKNVSKEEFLKAFNKNYQPAQNKDSAIREYLELYKRFKLKVQAAYDMGMDTLPNQVEDLQSFRKQLEPPYLTNQAEINRLTKEAFQRSLKDIRLSHIFIAFRKDYLINPSASKSVTREDSLQAGKKVEEVYNRLKQGADFGEMAVAYSDDPTAKMNKGDIGYITVFSLPYAMENLAYSLETGKFSSPLTSAAGYHIFRKTDERKALGRVKAAQILIAVEPGATEVVKVKRRYLADSLLNLIKTGSPFEDLAKLYSNDKTSYNTGGIMPEFGVGKFDAQFEKAVFSIPANGMVSGPVETAYGFHILKLLEHLPVNQNEQDATPLLKEMVLADSRSQLAKASFEKQVMQKVRPEIIPVNQTDLSRQTDTFRLSGKSTAAGGLSEKSPLIRYAKKTITVSEWFQYAAQFYQTHPSEKIKYTELLPKFFQEKTLDYYRDHLEDYDPAFKAQYQEFKEGNLLFQVMENEVWSKAAADTAGLVSYYSTHKDKYQWGLSADALMVNSSDRKTAVEAVRQVKAAPGKWASLAGTSGGRIIADSGRFELSQLTSDPSSVTEPGFVTPIQVNPFDSSASFSYIIKLYSQTSMRTFDEARGLVINDYQTILEEKWIAELKRKYPIRMNDKVYQALLKENAR